MAHSLLYFQDWASPCLPPVSSGWGTALACDHHQEISSDSFQPVLLGNLYIPNVSLTLTLIYNYRLIIIFLNQSAASSASWSVLVISEPHCLSQHQTYYCKRVSRILNEGHTACSWALRQERNDFFLFQGALRTRHSLFAEIKWGSTAIPLPIHFSGLTHPRSFHSIYFSTIILYLVQISLKIQNKFN